MMPVSWMTQLRSYAAVALSPLALVAAQPGADHSDHSDGGYLVAPGDTLSEIARSFETSVDALVTANHLGKGGDLIYSGQRLQIPAAHQRNQRNAAGRRTRHDSPVGPHARRTVWHTVRPGDSVTALAVRYHAWTDEVIAANHLGRDGGLVVGQRIRIPVVLAALEPGSRARDRPRDQVRERRHPQRRTHAGRSGRRDHSGLPNPSHATVRRIVAGTAERYGVSPHLALAVSWQEAGWQQDHVSSAHAVGAMQVLPSTGRWIETVIGRSLDLRKVTDNATAGVVLLRELREAAHVRHAVAGYYQGLQSVRDHGMFEDTKHYVHNVLALRNRFRQGDYPY